MRKTLTVLSLCVYLAAFAIWENLKSPVTGAISAAQFDDTMHSYMAAKAINDNLPEQIGTVCLLVVLCLIWLYPSNKKPAQ